MKSDIGENLFSLSCLQTLPGKEFKVAHTIKTALEKLEGIDNYSLFKGFGSFDIIYLYKLPSIDYQLSSELVPRPIDGILKSNQFFCFPYLTEKNDAIFKNLSESSFVGFSMLKLNPSATITTPSIENLLKANILEALSKLDISI